MSGGVLDTWAGASTGLSGRSGRRGSCSELACEPPLGGALCVPLRELLAVLGE